MYTIVVADDEEELRKALIRQISWEKIGFRLVGEAENGIEALALVEQKAPDLLLTDIRMPFISGLELARQVREVRPSTQIAFLSGYDDFSYAQDAIRYNVIRYMLKPISVEELTENLCQIREKLDRMFSEFAGRRKSSGGLMEYLLPLLLSPQTPYSEEREERLRREAVTRQFLGPENCNIHYVVMSVSVWDIEGGNCTAYNHVHAVEVILKKYLKSAVFFLEDRITAVLAATPAAFEKFLHIITDELLQSMERILSLRCCIGVSCPTAYLSQLSTGCAEAADALRQAESKGGEICYLGDLAAEQSASSGPDLFDRAILYIEENFADAGMSLVAVSATIGVSPNYLSAQIKKRTGRSFVDYLTATRMEKARQLVTQSSMKVREIAEACGYSDQHYFSYCFKKYEGKSPNQLRQERMQQETEQTGEV